MHARRFYNGTQSYSWNRASYPGAISHPYASFISRKSHNEVAYEGYAAMCRRFGIEPKTFSEWEQRDAKTNATDAKVDGQFHRHDLRGAQVTYVGGGRGPDTRDEWDGSWDNAVRVLEG